MRGMRGAIGALVVTLLFGFGLIVLWHVHSASADINPQINFQGKLTNPDGTNVADGTYSIAFSLYTASSGGTAVWTETQSSVSVASGVFQVNLGSVTALPGSVNFNSPNIYLGIKVGSDPEMTPRIQFTAAPYAFNAQSLGGLLASGYGTLAGTQTWTGTNTYSSSLAANGGLSISGLETQTYGSGTTGSAKTISVTNTNTSSTPSTVSAATLTLAGTANVNAGANVLNALSFSAPTAATNNAFNGLYFASTGYTSILNVAGTSIINGNGVLQSVGLAGSYTGSVQLSNAADTFSGSTLTSSGATQAGSFNNTGSSFAANSSGQVTYANAASSGTTLVCNNGGQLAACTTYNSTGSFVQNQTAGAQSASFSISGSGTIATSLLTPLVDTPSGTTTLNVGTSNATSGINLNQNVTLAAGKNFAQSGASTFTTGTGAAAINGALTVNSTELVNITNAAALKIQNIGGTALLTADTSAMKITIGGAAQVTGALQVGSLQIGTSQTAGNLLTTDASGNTSFTAPIVKSVYNSTTLQTGNTIIWTGSVTCTSGACSAILSTNGATSGPAIFSSVLSVQCTAQGASTAANTYYCGYNSYTAGTKTLALELVYAGGALAAPSTQNGTVYVTVIGQ